MKTESKKEEGDKRKKCPCCGSTAIFANVFYFERGKHKKTKEKTEIKTPIFPWKFSVTCLNCGKIFRY